MWFFPEAAILWEYIFLVALFFYALIWISHLRISLASDAFLELYFYAFFPVWSIANFIFSLSACWGNYESPTYISGKYFLDFARNLFSLFCAWNRENSSSSHLLSFFDYCMFPLSLYIFANSREKISFFSFFLTSYIYRSSSSYSIYSWDIFESHSLFHW